MKKRIKIAALCAAVVVLGAVNVPTQTQKTKSKEKSSQQGIFEWAKTDQATMGPAWYQYFSLQKTNISVSSSTPKLSFVVKGEQAEDLKVFELINTSSQNLQLPTQDGSLMMIQEAKNQQGKWQPIEYWRLDWGFGSQIESLNLMPQQSVVFTAPKYSGNFATEVRFKLKLNNQEIFYSDAFKAQIDLNHFKIDKNKLPKKISYLEQ